MLSIDLMRLAYANNDGNMHCGLSLNKVLSTV